MRRPFTGSFSRHFYDEPPPPLPHRPIIVYTRSTAAELPPSFPCTKMLHRPHMLISKAFDRRENIFVIADLSLFVVYSLRTVHFTPGMVFSVPLSPSKCVEECKRWCLYGAYWFSRFFLALYTILYYTTRLIGISVAFNFQTVKHEFTLFYLFLFCKNHYKPRSREDNNY